MNFMNVLDGVYPKERPASNCPLSIPSMEVLNISAVYAAKFMANVMIDTQTAFIDVPANTT